jgi:hypothetical protein
MTELRQKMPRVRDDGYLKWLRLQGCACGCGSPPPSDAAHLRAGSLAHDKPITGMGTKPDDRWCLPLRHDHHMAQHAFGDERLWWSAHGIDPFKAAKRYYAIYIASRPAEAAQRSARKPRRKAKTLPKPHSRQPNRRRWAKKPFPKGRGLPTGRKFRS